MRQWGEEVITQKAAVTILFTMFSYCNVSVAHESVSPTFKMSQSTTGFLFNTDACSAFSMAIILGNLQILYH